MHGQIFGRYHPKFALRKLQFRLHPKRKRFFEVVLPTAPIFSVNCLLYWIYKIIVNFALPQSAALALSELLLSNQ